MRDGRTAAAAQQQQRQHRTWENSAAVRNSTPVQKRQVGTSSHAAIASFTFSATRELKEEGRVSALEFARVHQRAARANLKSSVVVAPVPP